MIDRVVLVGEHEANRETLSDDDQPLVEVFEFTGFEDSIDVECQFSDPVASGSSVQGI